MNARAEEEAPKKRPGTAKKLAVAVLAFGLALALVEAGWRIKLRVDGEPWSAEFGRRRVAELLDETRGTVGLDHADENLTDGGKNSGLRLHPYYGYETRDGLDQQMKYREQFAAGLGEGQLTVLLFGGSVAALFGAGRDAVAKDFEEALTADPRAGGRTARLLRHSRPGFKQPQQLHAFIECLRQGYRPDVVINLDGYNELHLPILNVSYAMRSDWPSASHWSHLSAGALSPEQLDLAVEARAAELEAEAVAASGGRYLWSAVLGSLTLQRLERLRSRAHAANGAYVQARLASGAAPDQAAIDREETLPELVETWRASSLAMHQACEGAGIRYIHALQPTLHDAGSKPVHPREEKLGMKQGLLVHVDRGYDLMRAAGEELREAGVDFRDLSGIFAEERKPLYYDQCHFGRLGNLMLLEELAEAVLARL